MKERLLYTKKLTKNYKENKAINNIDMTVYKGDIYGFIGKNGAGKTTFIRTITKLINQTSGEFVFEKPNMKMSAMIEGPALYGDMTARNNLIYSSKLKGCYKKDKIDEVLEFVGLGDTGKKLVGNFSLGMKQRLGIGISIIDEPEFLILDEPINGLDPVGIVEIRNMIKKINEKMGATILISSHILSELEMVASRYGIIDNGKLIKELSCEELEKETASYAFLETSDNESAIDVLEDEIKGEVAIEGNVISFEATKDICHKISNRLLQKDVAIYQFKYEKKDLEDYFLRLVGR